MRPTPRKTALASPAYRQVKGGGGPCCDVCIFVVQGGHKKSCAGDKCHQAKEHQANSPWQRPSLLLDLLMGCHFPI